MKLGLLVWAALALATAATAQTVNANRILFPAANYFSIASGTGIPAPSCSGDAMYLQLDAPVGRSLWACVGGAMAQQVPAFALSEITGTAQIAQGGTGATSAAAARTALGVPTATSQLTNDANFIASGTVASVYHLAGTTSRPTVAGGTNVTATIPSGTDLAGQVQLVFSASSSAQVAATVTFTSAWSSAPYCILAFANSAANVSGYNKFYVSGSTTGTFVISVASGLTSGTYLLNYICAS